MIERRRLIVEHVRRKGAASIHDMAKVLGSTEVTIRRDIVALASNGVVKRTHGGAVVPQSLRRDFGQEGQFAAPGPSDLAIAMLAADLVQPGDSVVLGAGMATLALARELAALRNLTVVTNSLLIADALADAPGVDLILTGGVLRRSTMELVGPSAEQSFIGLRASMAILSGGGLTAQHGLSTGNATVAATNRAAALAADQIVALADHTVIGRDTLCQVVPCAAIGILYTDSDCDRDELQLIRNAGVDIRTAP